MEEPISSFAFNFNMRHCNSDMSKHAGFVAKLTEWVEREGSGGGGGGGGGGEGGDERYNSWVQPAIENASQADRQMLIALLLKCADLSNVVRPQTVADAWGKRIMEEFYRQGEKVGTHI